MNPLLIIWTARQIPTAHYHFRTLTNIDKLWVHGHTEWELAEALPTILNEHPEYTHATLIPDDCATSQQALTSVLARAADLDMRLFTQGGSYAIGGWSNCDFTHHYTNISTTPLLDPRPTSVDSYGRLLPIEVVAEKREPFPATFCGHTLFTMPTHLWIDETTRLQPCGTRDEMGHASDYSQCKRLQDAGIPLYVDPLAFVPHLKLDHTTTDAAGWKSLNLADKRIELEVVA